MTNASSDPRIEQFRKMAEADPNNELGHFSLGKALCESNQPSGAIGPLTRALELNPTLSKAYQLLGEAYHQSGDVDSAAKILTQGVTVADEQGDRMPRDAMAKRLKEWSQPVPQFKEAQVETDPSGLRGTSTEGFRCSRCSSPRGQLGRAPFKGELGEKILQNVCQSCWREWIPMGTKVINELGLMLRDSAAQEVYDQHMIEFLQLEGR